VGDRGRTDHHQPPRWRSATLGLMNLVVVRRQNSLFFHCMLQDCTEMTRISWISTSAHTHPLSPLIRTDASGIASMISFASRGLSPAEWGFKTTRTTRGRARNPQDPEPGRAHPLDALFEDYGRRGYVLSTEAVASTIVGSTSYATGAQNATRTHSSHGS
jgi:hypothetical protein